MIKKKDILAQNGSFVHVRHEAFLKEFDSYQIIVREKSVHQFELSKVYNGLTYICFMSAAEIISLQGAKYFTQLINNIQADAV